MSLYFSLDDRTVEALSVEFEIQDFIDSLWFNLGKGNAEYRQDYDFWSDVIRDASKGKAKLSMDQRKHLKLWVQQNYHHITRNFSNRAKHTLQLRLELL